MFHLWESGKSLGLLPGQATGRREEVGGDVSRTDRHAAPALEGMADSEIKERLLSWYAGRYEVWDDGEPMGLRTCNFSVLKARSYLRNH